MYHVKKLMGLAIAVTLLLAACGPKEEKDTFKGDASGVDMKVTLTHKGDKVTKENIRSTINYKDLGLKKDDMKSLLESESEKYQDIKGVSEKIKYSDGKAVETVKIDLEKVDLKELKKIAPESFSGDTKNKQVSYKKTKKALKKAGLKQVTKD
ncbi:DUF1307 domain-containing protein [Staphylococcus gallinarum]|uniref:Lipoprotein Lmo0207 n=1 Tax=Staphylococcus gallinarum TaxID=1293 RepID=A0ABQ0Y3E7_STAGA|nr:DUF1307 domain-containing protein [Staphylococcus gallinarum]KIR10021.1 hypothetical protein SH09_14500 [Staphylococcus gallinarum]MCD8821313.1 DUF1307 domain-containing protein [Staphylococcus gallinarum]MCD8844442.1 DUF1307 domain-containing protein [Staphylococcus gallinarum]MCD8899963.1 DUF1307 domain-containing protein [Staphylococcus gallinarum]MCD8903466.1 DUF1307 domain-containing protein [Staphylococcus gallinarum]